MGRGPARASQHSLPAPPLPLPPLLLLLLLLLVDGALLAGGQLGGRCTSYRECAAVVTYSECREGQCACRANLVASRDRTRCLPPLKLHYRCDDDVQCSGVPHAACLLDERGNQLCACSARYVLHADRCLPRSHLHEACEVSVQCRRNMECEAGRCVCKGFAFEHKRQCVTDVDDFDEAEGRTNASQGTDLQRNYASLESSSSHLVSSFMLICIVLLPLL